MKKRGSTRFIVLCICLLLIVLSGCSQEDKPKGSEAQKPDASQAVPQTTTPPAMAVQTTPLAPAGTTPEVAPAKPTNPSDVVVEVDGRKLTQGQIDADLKRKMTALKDKIPANQMTQARAGIKKKVVEEFIIRTLLADEVKRRKITVADKEVTEGIEQMKKSLPQGVTMDDLMKKNQVTQEQMRQEIALGIKVRKLVLASMSSKKKPTEKEISDFYKKNKDKFLTPETARARHILIAKAASDDDKIKADKRARAESLRIQLLSGADFAELAAKNSDCPSKGNGGDLGVFPRGQMVKAFDAAAFSQKINDIGSVVETEFGYHIIQVTERNVPKPMALNKDVKERVSAFLESQKQQEAFGQLVKRLREKASVIIYREP